MDPDLDPWDQLYKDQPDPDPQHWPLDSFSKNKFIALLLLLHVNFLITGHTTQRSAGHMLHTQVV
jgi:hypothetical protein